MLLKKRTISTSIELLPVGAYFLRVEWIIEGDKYIFYPSSAMGNQFGGFLSSLYYLYEERYERDDEPFVDRLQIDEHNVCNTNFSYHHATRRKDGGKWDIKYSNSPEETGCVMAGFTWDSEGDIMKVSFSRHFSYEDNIFPIPDKSDPIDIVIENSGKKYSYRIEAKDLCYAAAKAYTEAIKKCGIHGYITTTADCGGRSDLINIEHLMFVKAYALNCLDVRQTKVIWRKGEWMECEGSSFEKELELLLFDM